MLRLSGNTSHSQMQIASTTLFLDGEITGGPAVMKDVMNISRGNNFSLFFLSGLYPKSFNVIG